MENVEDKVRLTKLEQMRLWELGFFAHVQICKEDLEMQEFKERMGID